MKTLWMERYQRGIVVLVSVIIPAYNAEKYVGRAIRSVLAQTYPNIEIIVVDDGSKDQTRDIVKKFQDKVILIEQGNEGHAKARNAGLNAARGDLIAFLDADDYWLPEKTAEQVAVFQKRPDVGLVHCDLTKIDEKGSVVNHYYRDPKYVNGYILEPLLTRKGHIATSTAMFRKECVERCGKMDETMKEVGSEDREFWYRITKVYPAYYQEQSLVRYEFRQSSLSRSRKLENKLKGRTIAIDKALKGYKPWRAWLVRRKSYSAVYRETAYDFYSRKHYRDAFNFYVKTFQAWPFQIKALKAFMISLIRKGETHA